MRLRVFLFICALLAVLLCRPELDGIGAAGNLGSGLEISECTVKFPERVPLASERIGILSEVLDEGTHVQRGQIVARLQDDVLAAALAVAETRAASDVEVRVARKEQELAQAEYDAGLRANQDRNTYPATEITRRRLAAEAATLRIEQAMEELEVRRKLRDEALADLETSYLRAPFDGLVTLKVMRVGQGVRQAEPILEVTNTRVVHVEGSVPLNEVHRWRVGKRVEVYADLSAADDLQSGIRTPAPRREVGPFSGVIGFVDVSIRPLSRVVRVWAAVPNLDGRLRDGMDARMVLVE